MIYQHQTIYKILAAFLIGVVLITAVPQPVFAQGETPTDPTPITVTDDEVVVEPRITFVLRFTEKIQLTFTLSPRFIFDPFMKLFDNGFLSIQLDFLNYLAPASSLTATPSAQPSATPTPKP
ncbi:MAG: hypothetical protein MUO40_09995 [Anaerolineaceae bacterium]|nr:hypothetical protein [Anaerolineaceae bacterium]